MGWEGVSVPRRKKFRANAQDARGDGPAGDAADAPAHIVELLSSTTLAEQLVHDQAQQGERDGEGTSSPTPQAMLAMKDMKPPVGADSRSQ